VFLDTCSERPFCEYKWNEHADNNWGNCSLYTDYVDNMDNCAEHEHGASSCPDYCDYYNHSVYECYGNTPHSEIVAACGVYNNWAYYFRLANTTGSLVMAQLFESMLTCEQAVSEEACANMACELSCSTNASSGTDGATSFTSTIVTTTTTTTTTAATTTTVMMTTTTMTTTTTTTVAATFIVRGTFSLSGLQNASSARANPDFELALTAAVANAFGVDAKYVTIVSVSLSERRLEVLGKIRKSYIGESERRKARRLSDGVVVEYTISGGGTSGDIVDTITNTSSSTLAAALLNATNEYPTLQEQVGSDMTVESIESPAVEDLTSDDADPYVVKNEMSTTDIIGVLLGMFIPMLLILCYVTKCGTTLLSQSSNKSKAGNVEGGKNNIEEE